jgi:hypothetical protein
VGIGVDGVTAPLLDRIARGGGARLLPRGGVKVDGLPRGLPACRRLLGGRLSSPGGSAPLLWCRLSHWKQAVACVSVVCVLVGGSGGGVLVLVARVVFVARVVVARDVFVL